MRRYATGLAAVLLLAQPVLAPVGADAPLYTIEDLGTIGGLVPTVTGVNASGQVSGFVIDTAGNSRAVRYSDPGGWSYVPGLESLASDTQDINAFGDVTGYVVTAEGSLRAYRYTATTGVLDLIAPMNGGSYTMGVGINASGEVTGFGDTSNPADGTRSFRASPGLTAQQLPNLGGSFVIALGINDAGQVVGAADTSSFVQHSILMNPDGTLVDFGGLNGSAASNGNAVDNAGRIVGWASINSDGVTQHAYKYTGSLADLDPTSSVLSSAEGIADGVSVGFFTLADGVTTRAFSHTDADGTIDLNTRIPADSGWTLTKAHAVSTSGSIVGDGVLNGAPRVFRLTPQLASPPPPPPPPPPSDTTAPKILALHATPDNVWPPFGQWVKVKLSVRATDDSRVPPVCELTKISADEGTSADAKITGPMSGQVKALRNRRFEERVYTFEVTCADKAGNAAQASVDVTVARDHECARRAITRASHQFRCLLAAVQHRYAKGPGRR
jgi:probable HAF family extracellular repeat protein